MRKQESMDLSMDLSIPLEEGLKKIRYLETALEDIFQKIQSVEDTVELLRQINIRLGKDVDTLIEMNFSKLPISVLVDYSKTRHNELGLKAEGLLVHMYKKAKKDNDRLSMKALYSAYPEMVMAIERDIYEKSLFDKTKEVETESGKQSLNTDDGGSDIPVGG